MKTTPMWRPVVTLVGVAVLAMTGAACSSDNSDSVGSGSAENSPAGNGATGSDASGNRATTTIAGAPAEEVSVSLVRLDVDLDEPIAAVAVPGGDSLLVAERAGTVVEVMLDTDGDVTGVEPVIDISDRVGGLDGERGLLGIALDPDGSQLFLTYTRSDDGADQLVSYALRSGDGPVVVDESTRRTLLDVPDPFANHNGGNIAFGPDGMLYTSFGDGGSSGDPEGNGQDRTTLLGKILRIDPSAPDGIPADNPFVDGTDGERPEIWATGVRNPWRFSFDRTTGDLWVADVGQDRIEEVSVLAASEGGGRGANLGWDLFEGNDTFDDADPAPGAASSGPFTEPVFTYTHDEGGCSITGGVVYRGEDIPALSGSYLFSDFCQPGLRALRMDEDGAVTESSLGGDVPSVVSFAEDPDGEVYVVSLDEGLFRLIVA